MKAGGNKAARVTLAGLVVFDRGTLSLWPWHETALRGSGVIMHVAPTGERAVRRLSIQQELIAKRARRRAIARRARGDGGFDELPSDAHGWKTACFITALALCGIALFTHIVAPMFKYTTTGSRGLDIAVIITGIIALALVIVSFAGATYLAWQPLRANVRRVHWSRKLLTWTDTIGAVHHTPISDITAATRGPLGITNTLVLRNGTKLISTSSSRDRQLVLHTLRPDLLPPAELRDGALTTKDTKRLLAIWFGGGTLGCILIASLAWLAGVLTLQLAKSLLLMLVMMPAIFAIVVGIDRVMHSRRRSS